jgi:hypothetical protein
LHLWIENDSIFINSGSEEISNDLVYVSEILYRAKFNLKDSFLIAVSKNKKKSCFKVYSVGILELKSDISPKIKKGLKFYCTNFEYRTGERLFGNAWRNDMKNGIWYYISKNNVLYIFTYKDNKLIRKEKFTNKQDYQILKTY